MRLTLLLTIIAAILLPLSSNAQTNPIETYTFSQPVATPPYGTGLRILAAPSGAANSLQSIAANTFLQPLLNLSDLSNPSTARTNLGLGTGNSPTFSGLTLTGMSGCVQATSGVLSGTGLSCGGGGGTPGGSNTQFQFNNSGSFAGSPNLLNGSGEIILNYNPSSLPSPFPGTVLQISGPVNSNVRTEIDSFGSGNGPIYATSFARGTATSPSAVQTGDHIGNFNSFGYGATGYSTSNRGGLRVSATENWTDAAQGTETDLDVTTAGTTTLIQELRAAGNGVVIGAPTGGFQGAGSLNMQSCFINGVACGGSGSTPGGSNTQVQFNNSGSFGGSPNLLIGSGEVIVNYNSSSLPSPFAGTVFQIGGANSVGVRAELDGWTAGGGPGPKWSTRFARGTAASPTAVQTGDAIGAFNSFGYGATGYSAATRGGFTVLGTENWTDAAQGTELDVDITAAGTTTLSQAARFTGSGMVLGAPTGGFQGAGTINATGLFINGVGVGAGGSGTVNNCSVIYAIAYYNTTGNVVSCLPSAGTSSTVLHGNASGAASFSPVALGTDVSGNLPVTNLGGGSGATSSTFWRGDGTWATPASSTTNFFTTASATTGGPTVYVLAMAGYVATAGNYVCTPSFTPTNGVNPTLNVNATGAKPIQLLTSTGLVSLAGGELPAAKPACFIYDGTNYVYNATQVAAPPLFATDTVTLPKWVGCQTYVITAAAQTITLPASTGLPTGGCVDITTIGVTVQLTPVSGDAIDNGQVGGGGANVAITLPADFSGQVTYSGTPGVTAFSIPLGPVQYFPLSWGVGQDLSLNTGGIDFGRFATPRVVYGVRCKNNTLAGGAQTMTFKYQTDAGGVMSAGTTIGATTFDMNANLGVEQTIALSSTPLLVPAAYSVGATVTGSATAGSGRCQYTYR